MRFSILGAIAAISTLAAMAQTVEMNTRLDPDRVSYLLHVNDIDTDLALISTIAMPGSDVRIAVSANARADRGTLSLDGDKWVWRAPDAPGPATLVFEKNGEARTLIIFVLTPFENGGQSSLNGFRIGTYSKTPFRGLDSYSAPTGFIDAKPEMLNMNISPNFTLGQFLCKQQPGHEPTYVLIRPAMLAKLEAVLDVVQDSGHDVDTLTVMSGFRTPWYNASIGNRTTSSRHLFGGAADIFVDADSNGWMDDLNGDGTVNVDDARTLAGWAEGVARAAGEDEWPAGGLGIYSANSVRGPFVHIDARGYRARW